MILVLAVLKVAFDVMGLELGSLADEQRILMHEIVPFVWWDP